MRLMETVIEEERLALVSRVNVVLHFVHEVVSHILVCPDCLLSATHIADARYSVDNGFVMMMVPHHTYHIEILLSIWLSREVVFVADLDRVVWI